MDEPRVSHHDLPSKHHSAEKLDTRSGTPLSSSSHRAIITKRPAWLDMLYGAVVGTGMFVVTLKTVPGMLLGVTVLATIGGCTFAAERRFGTRMPEVPEGSDTKDFVRSLAFLAAAIAAGWYIFDQSPQWELWQTVSACATTAIIAFVFFLLEAASQKRRVVTGSPEASALPLPEPCP